MNPILYINPSFLPPIWHTFLQNKNPQYRGTTNSNFKLLKMPSSDYHESVSVVSKSTVVPDRESPFQSLRLSVSDLPMLTCQYIQKGCLFSGTPASLSSDSLLSLLKLSLSKALSVFPPLAGRLSTDPATGHVSISCSDAGVHFVHARAPSLLVRHVYPAEGDIPAVFRKFFAFDDTLSYDGHSKPIAAVQVTELADGLFIGCTVNHAVVDGTSFWNFFNTFAQICRGGAAEVAKVSRPPSFSRDCVFATEAVLRFPGGRPAATFSGDDPIRERLFHFSRDAISALKKRANVEVKGNAVVLNESTESTEIIGKGSNDTWKAIIGDPAADISSFQSLSALLWRSVTRARNLPLTKSTTFRMAVNCRHRVSPKMDALYFGNAIQSIPTVALAGEVVARGLGWCAEQLHRNVVAHDDGMVKKGVEAWESDPRCFPLGNFDGAMITMGSSPRFPMYDNDFGWGKPVAVRSGKANKFDGKISAFPAREGNGAVDLEVVLAPETLAALEEDAEFMQYVG